MGLAAIGVGRRWQKLPPSRRVLRRRPYKSDCLSVEASGNNYAVRHPEATLKERTVSHGDTLVFKCRRSPRYADRYK